MSHDDPFRSFPTKFHVDIHVHSAAGDGQYAVILSKLEALMALSSEALAAIQAESTQVDSMLALFASLKQQLADILSGVTLPPQVQADIDAILTISNADAAKIAAATTTTPAGKPAPIGS